MAETYIKPVSRVSIDVNELWNFRELFFFFVWRDIKVKYKHTVLGVLWVVLQPVLMTLIFTYLFSMRMGFESGPLPYPVFVFAGFVVWNLFSSGVTAASSSVINSSSIIRKIYFPRLIIPFASVLTTVFDFLMTLIPFAALLIYYQIPVQAASVVLYFPISFVIVLLVSLGVGSFFSALNIKYRDFRYVIPFMIQGLMFITPVFYSGLNLKDPLFNMISKLNPVSVAIDCFRKAITPEAVVHPADIAIAAGIAALYFLIGVVYFKRSEHQFADIA